MHPQLFLFFITAVNSILERRNHSKFCTSRPLRTPALSPFKTLYCNFIIIIQSELKFQFLKLGGSLIVPIVRQIAIEVLKPFRMKALEIFREDPLMSSNRMNCLDFTNCMFFAFWFSDHFV